MSQNNMRDYYKYRPIPVSTSMKIFEQILDRIMRAVAQNRSITKFKNCNMSEHRTCIYTLKNK